MSDNLNEKPLPQTFVECGKCLGNINVSLFCKNCVLSLCEECGEKHKNEQHTILQRTITVLRLFGPSKIAVQCREHPEKEISVYCEICHCPCCASCQTKNHQHHTMSNIEDKYIETEKKLNEYSSMLDKDVKPKLDEMENQARVLINKDDTQVKRVIDDINDYRSEISQNLNKSCDNLINQVQDLSLKNNEWLLEIQNCKENLQSLSTDIENRLHQGSLDLIKYIPPNIQMLIPEFKSPQNKIPYFEPDRTIFGILKESVGHIRYEKKENVYERNSGRNTPPVKSTELVELKCFDSKINVSSLMKLDSNNAWIMHCCNDRMFLYNSTGNVVKSVKIDNCRGINDMTISKSGEIVMTCEDMKVRRSTSNDRVFILIDTNPFLCYGVCLTNKGEIVVCLNDNRENRKLAIYSPDGKNRLRDLRGEDKKGFHLIRYPFRVVQNGSDLCVVNEGRDVICLNEKGDVRWVYDDKQAKLREQFCPMGICLDKHLNLLVTDIKNNCIHYINNQGELIQIILPQCKEGMQRYRAISVNDSNQELWLGTFSGKIIIAKYLV